MNGIFPISVTASSESLGADAAANLVIEEFDEFAPGIIFVSGNTADYVIGAELTTAYN